MTPKARQPSKMGPRRLTMWRFAVFRISIQGFLDDSWSGYFGTQAISVEQDEDGGTVTHFSTEPVDQSALLGIINLLHSLALPLLAVELLSVE